MGKPKTAGALTRTRRTSYGFLATGWVRRRSWSRSDPPPGPAPPSANSTAAHPRRPTRSGARTRRRCTTPSRHRPRAAVSAYDPPVGLVPPLAGQRIPTLSRLPRLRLGGGAARASRWWGLVAVPIVALAVVAVIGASQSPASHPAAAHGSASRTAAAAHGRSAAGSDAGAGRVELEGRLCCRDERPGGHSARPRTRHAPVRRPRARTRARSTRPTTTRHPVAAAHHSTGSPAATVTEAAASPPPTESSPPASRPPSSAGSSRDRPHRPHLPSGATGSKPATGPAGPTRIGSVTGGCNPKCS